MESVGSIFTHKYPYPHEHSQHAITAVMFGCLFFISSDNMHTLIQKLDNNVKWWSMYICLIGVFYSFSSPFFGKTIKPSYSNFSRWYVAWIFIAALYHLPSFQSMGLDMRMNLSLFLTIYISSVLFLLVFHIVFLGLWYVGLVARVAGQRPQILKIIQNFAVISVACCVFYRHCGNRGVLQDKPFDRRNSNRFSFSFLTKEERNTWISKFLHMHEFKEQVCSSWFAHVGSASDYPFLSKWVIYGELVCSGSCSGPSNEISPIYSLWATFIGLYIANYVVERSSGLLWEDEHETGEIFYDQFSETEDFWFDFMADTGDGGNSSYAVTRLLAQPKLPVKINGTVHVLPRGNLLLIGGDLAYPNPSTFTYERRLFCPFEYALQPPSWYKPEHIAFNKPELPYGVSDLRVYDGPKCFVIPGNHDWFDGLQTFMRYICHKSWLGGWLLPQKKSYFALQLPKGWWIFGLHQALHGDIDVYQFNFFANLSHKIGPSDSVIVVTHEPSWLLDWYWDNNTGKNVHHLIHDYLKGRCKLRMAGDLHHYMRHSVDPSREPKSVQHLLVNGCGGVFLHPTHVFRGFNKSYGASYDCKASYPSFDDSSRIALGNILKFRKNWQFDIISGVIYFILVFSMFPQKRATIGVLHVSAHLMAALILMVLMELAVELCIRHNLLATSGFHTLYEWYRSMENEHFPDPTQLRARIEQWTFGLYPACIKYLMLAFDVPEVMSVTRSTICKAGLGALTRGGTIIYYASVFLYFWVLSTPVVSLIFGSYLYICINWFHIHFDEAFSSLRIANYKSFTRFHISSDGNLEVFTIAIDKVPMDSKLDHEWDLEQKQPLQMAHHRKFPSKWKAATSDTASTARVVDHFIVERTRLVLTS